MIWPWQMTAFGLPSEMHTAFPDRVPNLLIGIHLRHIGEQKESVVMQVKVRQARAKSFQQMVRRTGLEDIKSLSAMIIQSERFGTSLASALKVYADALRTRRKLRAEAAVGKAGIKMLFPIVLFILPALFVITLVPGLLSVLRDLKGGIGARRSAWSPSGRHPFGRRYAPDPDLHLHP